MTDVKRRRWFLRKRVLIPLGAGVGLLLLGYFVALPWVVRGRVEAVLRQLKLRDVTYHVTRATPWTSTVRDIDAGGGNRIDGVRVTYSAGGLWHRRVDNIAVKGLHLTADVRDGDVSIGPLDALLWGSTTQPSTNVSSPTALEASARDWPFRKIRVEDSELTVRTPERTITIPFSGRVEWPRVHVQGKGLTIDGAIGDPQATAIQFSGDALSGDEVSAILRAISPGVPVHLPGSVSASGTLSRSDGKTTFDAKLSATPPTAESARPTTQLAGTNVGIEQGVFHIAGTFGGGQNSLKLEANDVTLSESSLGATASGIGGAVNIVSLSPTIATAPRQELRVDKLSASKLDLTDAVAQFDVSPDKTLNVHDARATFLGGQVSAKDVRIKPGEPVAVTIVAKDVQLRDLLAILAQGKATGEGTVSGKLPLVIRPDGEVTLGEGSFEASAGGRLSVTDASTLESIAGEAAKNVTQTPQAQVRNNIVEALKDFEFQTVSAKLNNDVASVRMSGRGRTGARQALEYDLRVTGLNDLLRELISVQREVSREAARP